MPLGTIESSENHEILPGTGDEDVVWVATDVTLRFQPRDRDSWDKISQFFSTNLGSRRGSSGELVCTHLVQFRDIFCRYVKESGNITLINGKARKPEWFQTQNERKSKRTYV